MITWDDVLTDDDWVSLLASLGMSSDDILEAARNADQTYHEWCERRSEEW